ncbi:hypothetical protein HMJ29_15075 [Hymenobacter taeanensis]|uniref:DUF5034 domain-containing protein n=1 Tax=Hymenobacter taeanensis TaxID=2735321 RepID=A0A6M6BJX8_9BACT|nr:hypothetical protein [Hymenobacter taeanensis]QJX48178.1 hypothetical protein HMJ29_15075 [Hymenobacter taeanensis]
MKKAIALTTLLAIGFSLQNCDLYGCKCDKSKGKYFILTGISVENYKKRGDCCADKLENNQQVAFQDFSLDVRNFVRFYSAQLPQSSPFSLIPTASACDCIADGYLGSKQKLQSLTVITLEDFDAQHLANDTINDLLNAQFYLTSYDLNTYLLTDTATITQQGYTLTLKKKPELNPSFRVRVDVRLRGGEMYQATSSTAIMQ